MALIPPHRRAAPTPEQVAGGAGAYEPGGAYYTPPPVYSVPYGQTDTRGYGFDHPADTDSDPAYQAWLAQADLQGNNAMSEAKRRKAAAQEAYEQALEDLTTQGTNGRRQIQTNMLSRGIFRSGETQRRGTEFDNVIDQGRARTDQALVDQNGQIDTDLTNTLGNISMQATQQVSQAQQREALAQYYAQQQAAVTAAAPQAAVPQQAQAQIPVVGNPNYNPNVPLAPTYHPITSSAGISQASSKKPTASGNTGQLKQKKVGQLQ